MFRTHRLGTAVLAAVCGAAVVWAAAGCSHGSPLVDRAVTLPSGVVLPDGFYPLAGHYDPDNPEDHYDGWPRYVVSERDQMVMGYVPTQTITMGGGLAADEVPARQVVVSHFYMDLHEVTNAQFHRFRKRYCQCRCGDKDVYLDYWVSGLNNDHPVRGVSWWDARYYSKWVRKVLPTEGQWEAAARGGDRRIYPWGNEEHSEVTRYLCNSRTDRAGFDGYEYTAPVMNFAAGVSPYGMFQMSGNVAEWCADWYDPSRYAYPSVEDPPTGLNRGGRAFGDEHYPNPLHKILRESRIGPLRGDEKVIRGGSFSEPIERCRVDSRFAGRPGVHLNNVGFRCVLPLPPDGPRS